MNQLLSFGLKNIGTIQQLINGYGMIKQFFNGNNGFYPNQMNRPYINPYQQQPFNPYYQRPPFNPYYRPNQYQNMMNYGNMFRNIFRF